MDREEAKLINLNHAQKLAKERALAVQAETEYRVAEAKEVFLLFNAREFRNTQGKSKPYFQCQANDGILTAYMLGQGWSGEVPDHWFRAFKACEDRLAKSPREPYVRRTDTKESLVTPQIPTADVPKGSIPFSRQQLIELKKNGDAEKWRELIRRYGSVAIDRVLARVE